MNCTTQRPLPDNTQPSQETDNHARDGIRTRSPSANERPHTHAVDYAVIGIVLAIRLLFLYVLSSNQFFPFLHRMIQVMIVYGNAAQLMRSNDVLYV
jgi:hypothetical protein